MYGIRREMDIAAQEWLVNNIREIVLYDDLLEGEEIFRGPFSRHYHIPKTYHVGSVYVLPLAMTEDSHDSVIGESEVIWTPNQHVQFMTPSSALMLPGDYWKPPERYPPEVKTCSLMRVAEKLKGSMSGLLIGLLEELQGPGWRGVNRSSFNKSYVLHFYDLVYPGEPELNSRLAKLWGKW